MKTRDQLRAERASAHIAALKADLVKDYLVEARGFAPSVHQSGLGSALALLKAKGGLARGVLYEHVSGWVSETVFGEPKGDLLTLITKSQTPKLLRAQEEAMQYGAWLRRVAEAREPKARKA